MFELTGRPLQIMAVVAAILLPLLIAYLWSRRRSHSGNPLRRGDKINAPEAKLRIAASMARQSCPSAGRSCQLSLRPPGARKRRGFGT